MTETITLERAIANFKTNQTPENARILIDRLQENTYFLLLHPSLLEKENASKRRQIAQEVSQGIMKDVPVLLIKTETEAGTILPVFTSRQQLAKYPGAAKLDAIQIPFAALYLQIKNNEKIGSLIVNPEGNAIAFGRDQFLASFTPSIPSVEEKAFEAGTVLHFEDASKQLAPVSLKAIRKAAKRFNEINAVYAAKMVDDDGKRTWFFVIDADTRQPDGHSAILEAFLPTVGLRQAGMCYSTDELASGICEKFAPIYRK